MSKVSRLSPIVVSLGFFIAKSINGIEQIKLLDIAFFFVGSSVLWVSLLEIAIYFQIQEWESKYKIMLSI
ncbi:MAG: hypothetical protein U0Z26_12055 [Anaerolineales bacterium]